MTRQQYSELLKKCNETDLTDTSVGELSSIIVKLIDVIEHGFKISESDDNEKDYDCICDELVLENAYLEGKLDGIMSMIKDD